jgi:hypothetical protein
LTSYQHSPSPPVNLTDVGRNVVLTVRKALPQF